MTKPWKSLMIYVGKIYKGVDSDDQKRKTLKVIDVTFGGDVWVHRRSYGRELWSQERFLSFVDEASEVKSLFT